MQPLPDGGVKLKNGTAEAVVKMLYPPTTVHEDTGFADHDPDKQVSYLVFSPDAAAQSCRFMSAICLNPDAVPKFEILEEQNYLGVRMQTAGAVEELYLNLRAIHSPDTIDIQIGDWVTDAYLLHFTRALANDQPVQRFFVSDGSYLRHQGKSVMESLTKMSACWAPGDPLEIFSDSTSVTVQIGADSLPRSVKWNDRAITTGYDSESRLVSVRI